MHRVLFKIGNFEVYTYGFTLVLGFIVAIAVTIFRNKKKNVLNDDILDFSFYMLLAGIVGSRLVYVLLHLGEYMAHPLSMFNLREGGLAWHGAMAGGLLAFLIFSRIKKIDLYEFLDLAAPQMMLGLAIGRIGCFMNGCCFGIPSTHFCRVGGTGKRNSPARFLFSCLHFILLHDSLSSFSAGVLPMCLVFPMPSISVLLLSGSVSTGYTWGGKRALFMSLQGRKSRKKGADKHGEERTPGLAI